MPINFIFLKTFNSDFFLTEDWFTDQNSNSLETEDKINLTLIINSYRICKTYKETMRYSIEPSDWICVKNFLFSSLIKNIEI